MQRFPETVCSLALGVLLTATPWARSEESPAPAEARATERTSVAAAATADDASAAGVAEPALPPLSWAVAELGGDGRRTMGRFGANLGRNLVGVFSGENLKPFALGVGITGAGRLFDDSIRTRLRRPNEGFGRIGDQVGTTRSMLPAAGALLLLGRATHDAGFRAFSYDVAQATVVNGAYTLALKTALHRERPDGSSNLSFPSGHTSNAFAWAAVADAHYGHRVGLPAYLAAGLIGVSRIQRDKHYASDVLAGAALGYIVGHTVVRRDDEAARAPRRWTLSPTSGPGGSGVGLAFSIDLSRR